MRVVCISDTHARHADIPIPDGDVLLHAGDLTRRGQEADVRAFDRWLGTLPHPHKIVIAGNHDFNFELNPASRAWITNATYLQDEEVTVAGLRIWGSPWQPRFFDWAFNLDRGEELRRKWALIPRGIDVLLTHGPPHGILDCTESGEAVGCEELLDAVSWLGPRGERPGLRLHVFGHIHEAHGVLDRDGITFVNASMCDLGYRPVHAPVVVNL